jgi:excinuclease ABC subunit A
MEKPDVDLIEGLSPAISIEQKATSHNPRSTVGTVTEIHDYLRLLFARAGTPHCPEHGQPLEAQSVSQMVDHVLALPEDTKLMILAPVVAGRKGEQLDLFTELRAQGFVRVRVDGKVHEIDALPKLAKNSKHTIDVVVDRLKVRADARQRLAESFETALTHADGRAIAVEMDSGTEHLFSARFACPVCSYSLPELEPRCSPSTTRWAPARSATASARSASSTRRASSPTRTCRSPPAPSAAGTGATSSTSSCWPASPATTASTSTQPFEALPRPCARSCSTARPREDPFRYLSESGQQHQGARLRGHRPNLERRYKETDSVAVREELAKYLNTRPCPACDGTRLRAKRATC